jgi:hypothetical protein
MKSGRLPLVAILLVALLASGMTRYAADSLRMAGVDATARTSAASNLSRMNSFALGLLLGGLRGPLVMMLWTTSESQKSEKRLEDFDTKVEWIRLLQPEFDTVHLFQVWNKAYNISVQMATLANKYITILDAIDYAQRVDEERPNNINILSAIGGVYFDKLGASAEKYYYRRRVREETQARPQAQQFNRNDPRFRRLKHDVLLDEQGLLLPHLTELKHLRPFEPYPYGVSPFAIGYNYHKRAQILQRDHGQAHAQLSDSVIDSRPALALKNWAEEEWERGRRLELQALGMDVPLERIDLELPAADVGLDTQLKRPEFAAEVIFSYDATARLVPAADEEYQSHIDQFKGQQFLYQSHRDTMTAMGALTAGDRDYFKLLVAGASDPQLIERVRRSYSEAMRSYQLMILKYYTNDTAAERAFPAGVTRYSIERADVDHGHVLNLVLNLMMQEGLGMEHEEDVREYLSYIDRAATRLQQLPAAAAMAP